MNDSQVINTFVSGVLAAYTDLLRVGLPVAFFIAACNIGINIIITAFSGGKLRIGRSD